MSAAGGGIDPIIVAGPAGDPICIPSHSSGSAVSDSSEDGDDGCTTIAHLHPSSSYSVSSPLRDIAGGGDRLSRAVASALGGVKSPLFPKFGGGVRCRFLGGEGGGDGGSGDGDDGGDAPMCTTDGSGSN